MKLSLAVLALATGLSVAQFSGLPSCATDCANKFLAGGIGNCGRDVKCICSDSDFIGQISCCLIGACDSADQTKAIQFAHDICSGSGVTVPDSPVCSTASSSGAAAATTSASSSSSASSAASAASTTTSSSQTSAASGTVASSSSATTGAVSSVASAVSSALSSASSTSASGNPAPRATAGPMLGALGGLVAAVALL